MSVKPLNADNFDAETKSSEKCLIDFFADWCGPCMMLSPLVEELSEELDDVDFFKVDVDENPGLAARFNVYSIPALFVLKKGEVASDSVGYLTAEKLRRFVEEA